MPSKPLVKRKARADRARCLRMGALTGLAMLAGPTLACTVHTLQEPAAQRVLQDPRPVIRWSGAPGGPYRVQVAVVLPEARLLATHDVHTTQAEWRLPQALAVARASFKVRVTSGCEPAGATAPGDQGRADAEQALHAQAAAFHVDLRPGCRLPPDGVRFTARGLDWTPVPGAERYRIRKWQLGRVPGPLHAAPVLLWQRELGASATLPWLPPADAGEEGAVAGAVFTVQPVCAGREGDPVGVSGR